MSDHRPSWPDSIMNGQELRTSVRNLLLDVGGAGSQQRLEVNLMRKDSLRKMDVPTVRSTTTAKRPGSSRSLAGFRGSSVVLNRPQGLGEVEKFLTVSLNKKSPDESLGFCFKQIEGHLVISQITKGGLMDQNTDVKVGDLIWCINDQDCHSMNRGEAGELLRTQNSTVTIRVKKPTLAQRTYVEAKMEKTAKGESWGFTLGRRDASLMIKKTTAGGLAVTQTDLRPGYEILAIDGINTTHGMSFEEASKRLSKDEVNIRAKKPTLKKGMALHVTVTKDSPKTPIGVVIRLNEEGNLRITNIHHDSLAYHTQLEPGLVLEKINNTPVKGMTVKETANLLRDAPAGNVVIQARVP